MKFINFASAPLTKYCNEEHNILNGFNTLRFGTIFDFREEENVKLKDAGEGKFEYSVRFPELTPVSRSWVETLNKMRPGAVDAEKARIEGDKVSIEAITLHGSSVNSWVFCMSNGQSGAAGNISENYSSSWAIDGEKIDNFGSELARKLWAALRISDLPNELREQYTIQELQSGLGMNFRHSPVEYADRRIKIESEADFPPERLEALINEVPFIKPPLFQEESEYRFVFELLMNGRPVSVERGAKFVPLRSIDQFLKADTH